MKNNMNEMNDEMEITLNESYTFPVISKESFMRLADITASTIKTLEPKFKEIKTDFNEGIMLIVANTPNVMTAKADLNTVTITDKDRIVEVDEDSSSSKYIVFADDQNGNSLVFQNTDNILRGKVNSSNMQGQLKVGNTYEITVIGYRVPLLNMYENIIKMKEIK